MKLPINSTEIEDVMIFYLRDPVSGAIVKKLAIALSCPLTHIEKTAHYLTSPMIDEAIIFVTKDTNLVEKLRSYRDIENWRNFYFGCALCGGSLEPIGSCSWCKEKAPYQDDFRFYLPNIGVPLPEKIVKHLETIGYSFKYNPYYNLQAERFNREQKMFDLVRSPMRNRPIGRI